MGRLGQSCAKAATAARVSSWFENTATRAAGSKVEYDEDAAADMLTNPSLGPAPL
jgi:hypothetical protein